MKNNKTRKKRGYSLIESLVALGVLLLGIVPVATVATQSITSHYKAGEVEEVSRISQTVIDYIKSRGYDDLSGVSGTIFSINLVSGQTYYTIDGFGAKFGISQDLILLNSKGLNLSEVKLYIIMKKSNDIAVVKKTNGDQELDYVYYPTGENTEDAYNNDIIYGRLVFGYDDNNASNVTGKEKELMTTFTITPIENWK